MVGAAEETQLKRLELEVENGGGGAWDYLCLVHPNLRSKLGDDEWTLYEQVATAAMDCQHFDVAKDCLRSLRTKFPESTRVARLEGMLLEAKGSWAEAEKAYAHLLKDNPLDQVIHKRKVAMAQAQGNVSSAIECLNKYLEIFMADHDAWRELAEMYKQAAFCYEELILFQPTVPLHHLAYAEVLYTLGGLENLQMAKKYYASTIDLTGGKNSRALFETFVGERNRSVFSYAKCSAAISQLARGRKTSELPSLAATALMKDYKQRAPSKFPLLTSTLRNMKLLS
ncbi:hypothetical protein AAC387_Pa05g3005 [Persea americana]